MSSIDNKKAKRRKVKKATVSKAASSSGSSETVEVAAPDIPASAASHTDLNNEQTLKKLEVLMDAHDDDTVFKMLSFHRGTNPFLDRERCLLCKCERQDPPEAEAICRTESADKQSILNNPLAQLPLWVCPACRKAADQEMEKKPSIEHFLDEEAESFLPDISIKSGSEPTTPNGSLCTCEACTERRYIMIESDHDQETVDLQQCWTELRKVVRCLYGSRDDNKVDDVNAPADEHVTDLVHRLCSRDPHQLFLRLESQVREFVIETKVKLLKQLSTGFKTPPQAKKFISMMLYEYIHLCRVARRMTVLLKDLQNHLKRFKVTWELHNKHLFQSIVFSEPSIKNSLNLLTSQLRLGADSKESYNEDTYNLPRRYSKFEDEMSVINVVWRDCHQLIEQYNEEQSTQKLKQKMLREDWEFFKKQRKLLEKQVSKNPKTASFSHNLEAQFTETMRLMLQGNKPSSDELTCPRCNRKRCPCDECTITHMITCGIINPDVLDSANAPNPLTSHHNANFLHDPNRYRIDVSPPSMSSTTSSSGSSSPVIVDTERLNLPFQEIENQNEDEIQEEVEEHQCFDDDDPGGEADNVADGDDEADTDEDLYEKMHPVEFPDLPPLKPSYVVNFPLLPPLMMDEDEALRRADLGKQDPCNCDHCVSQAKLEQLKPEENQCQCHVCLQQQGKAVSTSLPQHIPPIPRPGELHLYPHIHGSTGLHSMGSGHVRPILQPNLYDLHLPNSQRHKSIIQQNKVPIKLDFDTPEGINDHIYHAYGDWDNTAYDSQMFLHSGKFESELLPPPPFSSPYTSSLLSEPLSLPGFLNTVSTPGLTSPPTNTSGFISSFANHSSATTTPSTSKITDYLSVLTTKDSLGEPVVSKHNQCSNQGGNTGQNHNPPCSRPATLGGNNTPKIPEKVPSQHCRKHNTQGIAKAGTAQQVVSQNGQVSSSGKVADSRAGTQPGPNMKPPGHVHACSHITNNMPASNPCSNMMHAPTSANNASVGTSTKCTEPDCDGNHDNDSYDDNCSEKSSSTTNSTNQKEGKYCDCCYCEFFGHGNPPMAPTSKNYAEMRDKLRLRLKKKAETKTDDLMSLKCTGPTIHAHVPNPIEAQCSSPCMESPVPSGEDPMDTKGLDELIKFINGTEEDDNKPLSAKALKRARQKQRKAEEKARQDAEELERERQRVALEKHRLLEAERKKAELASKKQKKQATARTNKSSSKAPVPATPTVAADSSTSLNSSTDSNVDKNVTQKKKGKHKEDLPVLQVNITYELEHGNEQVTTVPSSVDQRPPSSHTNSILANQNVLKTAMSRPNPQGSKVTSTPPSIDNRLTLQQKQNKNKEPLMSVAKSHVGNGEPGKITINPEHIAKITLQQQELLKKQTQQLIQLKLQQEAKKHLQLAQQQKQQTQALENQLAEATACLKSVQNGAAPQINPAHSAAAINKTQVKVPVKNNVKITVKTSGNVTQPSSTPRKVEQIKSLQELLRKPAQQLNLKVIQQNEMNKQDMQATQQPAMPRKGKKPADNLTQQSARYQEKPQQAMRAQEKPCQQYVNQQMMGSSSPSLPHNGVSLSAPGSPVKGQVRQPPQGQAQNGDVRTPTPDMKRRDQSKGKQQKDESPPSDQGRNSGGKNKKTRRKNKGGGDINFIDEVFMPKSESDIEGGEMDEVERELEEFKRFCVDSAPAKREKLQVNINIKDIFTKKKSGLTCN